MPEGHPEAFTETDVASGGGSKGVGFEGIARGTRAKAEEAHRLATTERIKQRAPIPRPRLGELPICLRMEALQ